MRPGFPSAGVNADAENSWQAAARRFYDAEAMEKTSPARHRLFLESYARVAERLGLGPSALVLDAGCGCGELTGALGEFHCRVVGVDLSLNSLHAAKSFHADSSFLGSDLARLPFRNQSFDGIAAITSLEFCPDRAAALAELRRVLRQGGRLYVDVRNASFLPFSLLTPLFPVLQKIGLIRPYPAPGFRDLSLDEWKDALSQAGFEVREIRPSVWPWNFGSPATRAKNLLIEMVRRLAPIRGHYMVGLVAEKA